ncbi:hypothetical protein BDW02DRAFT_565425 [Decorospora gaudefroyi]|uniref:Uncharacterized protein n=1 Tax=Decorospora gaudefroyi TaxID=184978 RepID=A0A6A5KWB3_9PLEO|nr:hypothetical protein BDW02DRAFT_565425 [Decorospora gaudefroyi]
MPSSITTAVPSGIIVNGPDWCIQGLYDIFGSDEQPYTYNECFNSTRGTSKESFETFCCDGRIIDTSSNLMGGGAGNLTEYELDLENLVCCRAGGRRLPGGIMPIDSDYTHCSASEAATPLASLAATNTENAAQYLVTYASAKQMEGTKMGDWVRTKDPTCLWVETASGAVELTEVTVPAAEITTLPPPTTDRFGRTIEPSMGDSITSASSPNPSSSPGAPPAAATTPSSAFWVHADRSLILSLSGLVVSLSALWLL